MGVVYLWGMTASKQLWSQTAGASRNAQSNIYSVYLLFIHLFVGRELNCCFVSGIQGEQDKEAFLVRVVKIWIWDGNICGKYFDSYLRNLLWLID